MLEHGWNASAHAHGGSHEGTAATSPAAAVLARTRLRLLCGLGALVVSMAWSPVARADQSIQTPSRWLGRVDGMSKRFAWPGSGFELDVVGGRLEATLSDTGKNSLTVDDGKTVRRIDLQQGRHSYVLAEDDPARRTIRVTRRTEGLFGPTMFVDARTTGRFVEADRPRRRILVLGDSVSAGLGIEGDNPRCAFSADTENHYLTFGAVLARRFQADLTTLAVSGLGLVRNYGDSKDPPLPKIVGRTIPTEPGTAGLSPVETGYDVVIVELGTNDFTDGSRPADYKAGYTALLADLRGAHPNAIIYAAVGPMLNPPDYAAAKTDIEAVVRQRREGGDSKVHDIAFLNDWNELGCNWHPNKVVHAGIADQLSAALAADAGWTDAQ